MNNRAYLQLEAENKRIDAIGGALAVLHWDRAVMMPAGGADARADQMAALQLILHEMQTAPRRADLIAEARAGADALDDWQEANLHEMERGLARATARPARLVEALAHARAQTEMAWRAARAADDFAAVAPRLAALLALAREEAGVLGQALGLDPYDALLDAYDPGLRAADFLPLFDTLARELPPLIDDVIERQAYQGPPLPLTGNFAVADQERLGRELMGALGFDFAHGRLDVSHHPFTGGVPEDTRITTRYREDDFIQALMAVIHETGHALYERGLPADWRGQPVGRARGMVLHESQSLLFEMQAARSPAFVSALAALAARAFGGTGPEWQAENLMRHYHRVAREPIRVDADEVTYPLHVIQRTRLETAMIAGDLAVADLPGAWNEAMRKLLGLAPRNDAEGCLQDIHWYSGAFGYFPTYTLGALAAAQLFRAALAEAPNIETELAQGRANALLAWAGARVHAKASRFDTAQVIQSASGAPLGVDIFLDHLRRRYLGGGDSALAGAPIGH